jgi:hypothetical protein
MGRCQNIVQTIIFSYTRYFSGDTDLNTVKGGSPLQVNSYSFLWTPAPAFGISVALMVLHENKRRYKCQRNVGTD